MADNTPVLIAGGSVVGLSTALFLAHHGVACLVVERNPGTARHPGFSGISARTMELYRGAGVEADILAVTGEQQRFGSVARARHLADPEITWFDAPWDGADMERVSPCEFCTCEQDRLEPVLVERARRWGADIRFNTELVDFDQDEQDDQDAAAGAVRAVIRNRDDGTESVVHASYLVAADGMRGRVRERLGIERTGPGVLEHRVNVLFHTDLEPTLHGRRLTACLVSDIDGSLVPRVSAPWLMSVPYRPDNGERVEDFTETRCLELIRAGVGRPNVAATVVDVLPWRPAALVAERFGRDRVFLVGDAAHVMPPAGAFGGNSGIHDAHNLAWKLAAVISGAAAPALLHTYETERMPVVERTVAEALGRMRSWFRTPGDPTPPREPLDDNTVMFSYRYRSTAVIAEDVASGDALFEDPHHPTGRPGSRAPHVWLGHAGERRSTLDLFGREFVLLTGPAAHGWQEAGQRLAGTAPLTCHRIGADSLSDVDGRWTAAYRVTEAGAVLVRPDGFIAWRATGSAEAADDPSGTLREVLARILGGRGTTR